jgi:hypothetical protein
MIGLAAITGGLVNVPAAGGMLITFPMVTEGWRYACCREYVQHGRFLPGLYRCDLCPNEGPARSEEEDLIPPAHRPANFPALKERMSCERHLLMWNRRLLQHLV